MENGRRRLAGQAGVYLQNLERARVHHHLDVHDALEPQAHGELLGDPGEAGQLLARVWSVDGSRYALTVVGAIELELRAEQTLRQAVAGDHLQRPRGAGRELLHDCLVTARLKGGAGCRQLVFVLREPHALAAAGPTRPDDGRKAAQGPRRGACHAELVEKAVGPQLGRRDAVGRGVEEQRHAPSNRVSGEPTERVVVLIGGQHGVAGQEELPGAIFVVGQVEDMRLGDQPGGGRTRPAVEKHDFVAGLEPEVGGLGALQLPAHNHESHRRPTATTCSRRHREWAASSHDSNSVGVAWRSPSSASRGRTSATVRRPSSTSYSAWATPQRPLRGGTSEVTTLAPASSRLRRPSIPSTSSDAGMRRSGISTRITAIVSTSFHVAGAGSSASGVWAWG